MSNCYFDPFTTGRPLSDFGSFIGCAAGQLHQLGAGLSLMPLLARHAERCFGALMYWRGSPVLGWSVRQPMMYLSTFNLSWSHGAAQHPVPGSLMSELSNV
jgi:hypothetical protein